MRTPLLLPVALILTLTGCGNDTGSAESRIAETPSAVAPSPVAESSPTAKRDGIVVDDTSVAGVRIGTPATEAERRLVAAFGPARKQSLPGCNDETGSWLSWDILTVVLSDEDAQGVVLRGWSVIGGTGRQKLALPYDVQPGTPVRDVLARVPGAKGTPGEGATEGQYLVHLPKTPDLLWLSGSFDDSGVVDEVSFRNATCD